MLVWTIRPIGTSRWGYMKPLNRFLSCITCLFLTGHRPGRHVGSCFFRSRGIWDQAKTDVAAAAFAEVVIAVQQRTPIVCRHHVCCYDTNPKHKRGECSCLSFDVLPTFNSHLYWYNRSWILVWYTHFQKCCSKTILGRGWCFPFENSL